MSTATISKFADAEAVSQAAAAEVVRVGGEAIAQRGCFSLVLCGGSTPRRLYEILAARWRAGLDWTKVDFFWGDERAVPPEHADSNFGMARKAMLQPLGIAEGRIHRMQGEHDDLDAAARAYVSEIAQVLGAAKATGFDLVLLGMGADGHTASLFPHTSALHEKSRSVVANHVAKLDTRRLTMTTAILNRAAAVLFVVVGDDKAVALAEILEGVADGERLPAQLIEPGGGRLQWFVDERAAARLQRSMVRVAPGEDASRG